MLLTAEQLLLTVTATVLYRGLFRMRKSYNATSLDVWSFIDSSQKAKLREQRVTCDKYPVFKEESHGLLMEHRF